MDPITLVMGLSTVVPEVLKWLGHDKAADSAQKILTVAQQVTGATTPDAAVEAIQQNPTLAYQMQQELDHHSEELAKIQQVTDLAEIKATSDNMQAVNTTMQTEAKSDHWPTYTWRPFVGFCYGLEALISAVVVLAAYVGVMFYKVDGKVLEYIPPMLGAMAGVMATQTAVLGIASYWRGKMQADPRVPTDNRG